MSENPTRIRDSRRDTPEGAYEHARALAQRAVTLEAMTAQTKSAAIEKLTRRHKFGSWLLKLHRGDKVTIHLHFYERLCRALEEIVEKQEQRLAHERAALAALRGQENENSEADRASVRGSDRAPVRAI